MAFRWLVGIAENLEFIAPPQKGLLGDPRLVWTIFAALVLLVGACAAAGFFFPLSKPKHERTKLEWNQRLGCGCLVVPIVFLILSFALMVKLWGCPDMNAVGWERRGNQHADAAFAYYLEHHRAAEDLGDAGVNLDGHSRVGWVYSSSNDLLHLELEFSDYAACGWMISWQFSAYWTSATSLQVRGMKAEARQLFDLILVYKLAQGAYPSSIEELGLDSSWGDYGPWSLAPSTEKSEPPLRFRGRPTPWSSIRVHTSDQDSVGEEMITYRDFGWYHDT